MCSILCHQSNLDVFSFGLFLPLIGQSSDRRGKERSVVTCSKGSEPGLNPGCNAV